MLLPGGLLWSGPVVSSVDEVIQKGETVLLIRYSPWSYHRCSPGKLDKWSRGKKQELDWTPIVKPVTQFVPLQILFGQSKNFLVVEMVDRRIWQLDSSMQVLSSMKLPENLKQAKLEEYRLFWSEGHRFTFVNVSAGMVYQYLETGGRLSLLRSSRIPLSCRGCYMARGDTVSYDYAEFPYTCVTSSSLTVFDRSFSGSQKITTMKPRILEGLKDEPFSDIPILILDDTQSPVLVYRISEKTYCFKPEKGEFSYCP
jgi:hypothetical protein